MTSSQTTDPQQHGELAPWSRRVAAALVDELILFAVASAVLFAVGVRPLWSLGHQHASHGQLLARYVAVVVAAAVYYPPVMRLTNGQTIGKRLLGIRVVRTDGSRMTLARAVWREAVVKIALFEALMLAPALAVAGSLVSLADSLWPLGDREHRALHDMLAFTRVRYADAVP